MYPLSYPLHWDLGRVSNYHLYNNFINKVLSNTHYSWKIYGFSSIISQDFKVMSDSSRFWAMLLG